MGTAIEVDVTGFVKNMGRHHGPTMFIIYHSGDCVLFLFCVVATQGHAADDVTNYQFELFTIIFHLFSSSLCRSVLGWFMQPA